MLIQYSQSKLEIKTVAAKSLNPQAFRFKLLELYFGDKIGFADDRAWRGDSLNLYTSRF